MSGLIVFSGAAVVSLIFAGAVLGWLVVAVVVLGVRIRRRPRRPPYHTASLEFQFEWRKFVGRTAPWVTVGAAFPTLLFAFPALGVTGILLAAVLLQRFQKAAGNLGLWLIREKEAPSDYPRKGELFPAPASSATPLMAPLDFIATPNGKSLLRDSLRKMDMDPETWQVIGQPNRHQASLLADRSIGGERFILRIFASDGEAFRTRELEFRQTAGDFTPLWSRQSTAATIAGLPGIVVRLPRANPPDPDQVVSASEAQEWQLSWEIRCLSTSDRRKLWRHQQVLSTTRPIPDPEAFLLPHLQVLTQVNGAHQKPARQLLRIFPVIRERFLSGPAIYSLERQVSPLSLLRLADGSVEPLDLSKLEVSLPGIAWSDTPGFRKLVTAREHLFELGEDQELDDAWFRAKVRDCGSHAAGRNLRAFATDVDGLLRMHYERTGIKAPLH